MMISFLIVLSVAAAVGNLGMMAFWYSRVRRLKGKPERVYGSMPIVVTGQQHTRCPLDVVQEGHVYRFILRGCWKGICIVDRVDPTGVLAVSVVSPSYQMWERFARNKLPTWGEGRVMRFDINWFRDVTGFSEVTE